MATVLTVAAVAEATGYSVQQIRDLERLRVIAPAVRADNGYRQFGDAHIADLRAYRDLAHAVGPVDARDAMRAIRALPLDEATALVCAFHVRLDRQRDQALVARAAAQTIHAEERTDAVAVDADAMTITELSRALGIRSSTLRFWEQAGLVTPERVRTPGGSARRYHLAAIREARVTAALRTAGYRIPDVRQAVAAMRDLDDIGDSVAALDAHLDGLARRMLALLRASARLSEIIRAGCEDERHGRELSRATTDPDEAR